MADPYFDNVSLLLPFEPQGNLAAGLIDVSNAHRVCTVTPVGGYVPVLSSSIKKYGTYSIGTPGLSGVQIEIGRWEDFIFGLADFTVEAWVYPTMPNVWRTIIGQWGNAFDNCWSLHLHNSNGLAFFYNSSTTGYAVFAAANSVPANTWTHVAASRNGANLRIFVNGVQAGLHTGYAGLSVGGNRAVRMFVSPVVGDSLTGYLDDVRITNGVGRYTADFTPAACEYPLQSHPTDQIGRFQDLRGYEAPAGSGRYEAAERGSYDYWYGGRGRIVATTKIKGTPNTPVSRRVRLHEQITGNFVKETWSDAAGNYVFDYLDPSRRYYAVAFDHTGAYQGVVADQLVPEAF